MTGTRVATTGVNGARGYNGQLTNSNQASSPVDPQYVGRHLPDTNEASELEALLGILGLTTLIGWFGLRRKHDSLKH